MISRELWILAGTAASIGFVHTVIGPDHYLPFIVISRARRWTMRKTLAVSLLAGLGHILSSVVLGFAGIALGLAVARLKGVESFRGELAAWLLVGFGLVYFIWGMRRAWKNKPHAHAHFHAADAAHEHVHTHADPDHVHVHETAGKINITPWVLFTIFVFGPCEPLIPLVMYPAARHSSAGVVAVTAAFGLTTILTMLTIIA
ncbi:MAG TPA: sulfite exporter TauE/SafE family protein, partial [Methanocella sp.]|nr:sulfite exporter TauE/SafE family protein [Methanocella sp.]